MNNNEILSKLNEKVYGHVSAKKTLITLVRRSKMRYLQKWGHNIKTPIDTMNCLLVGDSGTGKTHLIESLAGIMDFPFLRIDATSLTPTGNNDGINQKKLRLMILDTAKAYVKGSPEYLNRTVEGAVDQMVVFVDEVDKLANSFDSSGNWNAHVQAGFLTLIDDKQELKGVSWVFAGAFSGIERGATTNALGFTGTSTEASKDITDADIIKEGLIPELVGRIGSISVLDTFTEQDYINILEGGLLESKYDELSSCGVVSAVMNYEDVKELAKTAAESGQGVRSLKRELDNYYLEDEFNLAVG